MVVPKAGRTVVSPKEQRTIDGITFASKFEARIYQELRALVGLDKLTLQPRFELLEAFVGPDGTKHRAINYVGDFLVTTPDGQELVVDAKGQILPAYVIKRKLFTHRYKRVLHEIHTLTQLHELLRQHGVQI